MPNIIHTSLTGPQPHEAMPNVSYYLNGASFPAIREDLVAVAEDNDAPDDILEKLDALPQGTFRNMEEVLKACGTQQDREDGIEDATDTTEVLSENTDMDSGLNNFMDVDTGTDEETRYLSISEQQDRIWQGNAGSTEQLNRNRSFTTTASSIRNNPLEAMLNGEDDEDDETPQDISGASSQGQGYERAGGKTETQSPFPAHDVRVTRHPADQPDKAPEIINRRPY